MRLLALETSSDRCSVALWNGGETTDRWASAAATHSEFLLPFVGELLADSGLRLRELDAIGFGAGPGGFTGLRLACAVAQGMAFGAELPVIAVGSLEALAWGSGAHRAYACVDARMGEVYCAAYERSLAGPEPVIAPCVRPPRDAPAPPGEGWSGCGNGIGTCLQAAPERFAGFLATDVRAVPEARAVAELAVARFARGEWLDPEAAVPMYVRDKVALTRDERRVRGIQA